MLLSIHSLFTRPCFCHSSFMASLLFLSLLINSPCSFFSLFTHPHPPHPALFAPLSLHYSLCSLPLFHSTLCNTRHSIHPLIIPLHFHLILHSHASTLLPLSSSAPLPPHSLYAHNVLYWINLLLNFLSTNFSLCSLQSLFSPMSLHSPLPCNLFWSWCTWYEPLLFVLFCPATFLFLPFAVHNIPPSILSNLLILNLLHAFWHNHLTTPFFHSCALHSVRTNVH